MLTRIGRCWQVLAASGLNLVNQQLAAQFRVLGGQAIAQARLVQQAYVDQLCVYGRGHNDDVPPSPTPYGSGLLDSQQEPVERAINNATHESHREIIAVVIVDAACVMTL